SENYNHQEATPDRRHSGKTANPVTCGNASPRLDSQDDRVCAESGRTNLPHHENDGDGCVRTDTTALKLTKLLRAKGAPPSAALASAVKAKPSTGDNFAGNDRKAAKLSKAKPATKKFNDLKDLIASLAPESTMIKHKPKITTAPTCGRVKEEERNVGV